MFKNGRLEYKNEVEDQIEYIRIIDNNYISGNNQTDLSPFDIYKTGIIPTKNLLLKYIDLKQKPDIKIENQERLLEWFIDECLKTKNVSDWKPTHQYNNVLYGSSEISLPVFLNHKMNCIAASTRVRPGNRVLFNVEDISYFDYYKLSAIDTQNGTTRFRQTNTEVPSSIFYGSVYVPKGTIIVYLDNDDQRYNLFQRYENSIYIIKDEEYCVGNFYDSIQVIKIVDDITQEKDNRIEELEKELNNLKQKLDDILGNKS